MTLRAAGLAATLLVLACPAPVSAAATATYIVGGYVTGCPGLVGRECNVYVACVAGVGVGACEFPGLGARATVTVRDQLAGPWGFHWHACLGHEGNASGTATLDLPEGCRQLIVTPEAGSATGTITVE